MGMTNVLSGIVEGRDGPQAHVRVGTVGLVVADAAARHGEPVTLCLRPEALRILAPGEAPFPGEGLFAGTVKNSEFIGALTRLDVELPDGTPLKVAALDHPYSRAIPGSTIVLAYDPGRLSIFRSGAT